MEEGRQEEKRVKPNPAEVERILTKVRKLMALSKGSSFQAEAELAAEMAAKVMAEYNVTAEDVIREEIRGAADDAVISDVVFTPESSMAGKNVSSLVVGIGRLFDCEVKWGRDDAGRDCLRVFGYKTDVLIAKWTLGYVLEQLIRACMESFVLNGGGKKINGRAPRRGAVENFMQSFFLGAASGVWKTLNRLLEEKKRAAEEAAKGQNCTALIVVKKDAIRERFGSFNYGTTKVGRQVDGRAYGDGVKAGEKVQIRRGVGESTGAGSSQKLLQ